jgi:hypothetical protein
VILDELAYSNPLVEKSSLTVLIKDNYGGDAIVWTEQPQVITISLGAHSGFDLTWIALKLKTASL